MAAYWDRDEHRDKLSTTLFREGDKPKIKLCGKSWGSCFVKQTYLQLGLYVPAICIFLA